MSMNKTRSMLALLLALVLTVGAGPAWAVPSFISTYRASVDLTEGDSGVDTTPMTPSSLTFCFLTEVTVRDNDDLEFPECLVQKGNGDFPWTLAAKIATVEGNDEDAAIFCEAACFTNN
jgi:hypothetical protein